MIPNKNQLEQCIREHSDEGFFATFLFRKISIRITKYVAMTELTPNQITFFSFLLVLISIIFLFTGHLITAGILYFLSYVFDNVDGEIARLKNKQSNSGFLFDSTLDRVKEGIIFFALMIYTGYWITGFIAFFSIYMTNMVVESIGKRDKFTLGEVHANIFNKTKFKRSFLTSGIDMQVMIISGGLILNQILLSLIYFIVIQNIYWIAIFILVFRGWKK